MKNEINLLAVAVTASNSADSIEALIKSIPDFEDELNEAVDALRSLSYTLAGYWLDHNPINED